MFRISPVARSPAMTSLRQFRFLFLALCVVAACERDARQVSGPEGGPRFALASAAGGASATGRHIVSFQGQVPADFTARVAALGGTVVWLSPGSGLAAV